MITIAQMPAHSMTQLEYLIALVSIIVGLGLTDLARSLRELVRPGRTVHWHWLSLTWAAIAFLLIVQIWWQSFGFLQTDALAHAAVFTPVLLGFLLLYLICAFALPDPDRTHVGDDAPPQPDASGRGALDLEAFYFSTAHRRWFFGAFVGLLVASQLFNLTAWSVQGDQIIDTVRLVKNVGVNLVLASLLGGLIATNRRWVHGGAALFVMGTMLYTLVTGMPTIS
jgi:hypothetical protein